MAKYHQDGKEDCSPFRMSLQECSYIISGVQTAQSFLKNILKVHFRNFKNIHNLGPVIPLLGNYAKKRIK